MQKTALCHLKHDQQKLVFLYKRVEYVLGTTLFPGKMLKCNTLKSFGLNMGLDGFQTDKNFQIFKKFKMFS